MTVKTSISLTDAQEAYARKLVEEGRYSSLSAVLQQGLEMLRLETEAKEAEAAALKALLMERAQGPFVSMDESDAEIDAMLKRKREQCLGQTRKV
ncbi:MAG TPA: type II toxin-antitoxin system ParD family antitoxin [Vitreimonas sp.]|uniref:type II toxin-antitoxin system ParD family antitoxin n=1 Tax=Vitreimonas sp. TaxID=3069702 RepID=UPI002D529AD5|nr:type II toxin-antitoxin system ParD family antitoxin [Vitreimonas sp.]HYD89502.1 type II toxin-antitoxin system ParD family antitoxin [Vitreimonas sp.]